MRANSLLLSSVRALSRLALLGFVSSASAAHAAGGITYGALHGSVVRADGLSSVGTQVVVRDANGTLDVLLTADRSGSFQCLTLSPGKYSLMPVQAGRKSGREAVVQISAGADVVARLEMEPAYALTGLGESSSTDPSAQVGTAAASLVPLPPNGGFFHRLGRAYGADWAGNGPTTAIPQEKRRGTDPPLASPPYPATDWPIGGTVVIGSPDGQTYPLMQALNMNKGVNKIYGWVEVGANGSTNNKTNASKGIAANVPAAYDVYSNTVQLDQAALYFEKIENTAQKDHFDSGYRLTLLYGVDYRFTTAHGILSQQLLVKNNQYGFDPVMYYYDAYFPHVAQGLIVRVGRYISLPDIEAQLAPNNYTYSHSILYTYDCYTQTGTNATLKLNDHWTVQGGISAGCDTAPWTTDAKLTGNACLIYTWSQGGDALNTCDNSINDSKYAYNNLTAYYETWYHRINATWHMDTEGWYQYMKDTPNMYWFNGTDPATGTQYAPTAAHPWPEATFYRPGQGAVNLNFGAVCQDPRLSASKQSARCFAPEWAITNYVEHNFWNNTASLNIRNEFVDDIKGQRSGTPAKYEEHMVGFDFWAGSTITFRPELSYTRCYSKYKTLDGKPVSCTDIAAGGSIASDESQWQGNGTIPTGRGKTQSLTLAADLIWHF